MDEQKIIRYLDGEMSPSERKAFESELDADPSLRSELNAYRQIQDMAKQILSSKDSDEVEGEQPDPATRKDIEEAVRAFKEGKAESLPPGHAAKLKESAARYFRDRSAQPPGSLRVRLPRTWFVLAALLLLALVVSMYLFKPPGPEDPRILFARNFEAFQPMVEEYGDIRTDDGLRFAMEVYASGNFERALTLFDPFLQSPAYRELAHFYKAQCYMALDQCPEAIPLLKGITGTQESSWRVPAIWYLALCYLDTGELEMARRQFQSLLEADTEYKRKVKQILRRLP